MAAKATYHPQFSVRLPASLQRRVKLYAARQDMTVQALVTEIIREYFQAHQPRRNGKRKSA